MIVRLFYYSGYTVFLKQKILADHSPQNCIISRDNVDYKYSENT